MNKNKVEDSLKRLQRVRQNKSSAANLSTLGNGTASMSDDDKIRLQLVIDITEFGNKLEENFDGYKGESNYEFLYKLVEELNAKLLNNNSNKNLTTTKENESETI